MTGKEQQDLEQEIFGYTHGTLGAMLTENFGLPELLADMIRHHHQPMEAEFREETTIIHLADILSNCFKVGTSGQYYIPRLRIAAPGLLEGGESLIEDTRTTMNSYTSELMGILLIE